MIWDTNGYIIQSNPEGNTKTCVHIDSDFKVLINNLAICWDPWEKLRYQSGSQNPWPKDGYEENVIQPIVNRNMPRKEPVYFNLVKINNYKNGVEY
jgi:hypothetical protein